MIFGLIPQELHEQLLDSKNYQNRTNGVEELKNVLLDLDLQPIPSDSIVEFINFLQRLLDDSNFKVLYGTLEVINLLIQKLDCNVDKYFKHIACAALKTLGDTRTVTRNEYMHVFRQLMRIVGPQKVLDLVLEHLNDKNSRVREDVINIVTAAMLTHPRKDFDIPSLCFEVAPYLADGKKKVRHAALELFAVLDYCLDTGKKQPLMKAVDRVELNADVEGLMAAVQARRARHTLPRLSSEGIVEYALVVPKSGQRRSPQFGSGADLEWVVNGGRSSSARSLRSEQESDRLYGYGSLGSLTDDLPWQRRIVSAGKGKNKLPWERSSIPTTENAQPCGALNGKSTEQDIGEDSLSLSRKPNTETYVPSFGCAEPPKPLGSRRRGSPVLLRRSGSLDSDPDVFKSSHFSETDGVAPKARLLSGNPGVERTFSLPSHPSTPGSFLLPSYPLAHLPRAALTPTLARRRADSSLSMSNTWPNKRDNSPHRREPSPWTDATGDLTSSRCSPRPLRASLVNSASSASSFRRALSSSRSGLPVSPGPPPPPDRAPSQDGQRPHPLQGGPLPPDQQPERSLHLDLAHLGMQDQEEDHLDREEMMNSLRRLRDSAAKKRAKVSLSGSEPDSPDSAVRLELAMDSPCHASPGHASPTVLSPASESGLSSLYSPPNSTLNGSKTSPGNSASSAGKPRAARVPSAKLRSSVSMDFSALQAFPLRDKVSPEVSVIGQRVAYSNGRTDPEEEDWPGEPSPPPHRPTGREPIRALRPAKGSQSYSSRSSPATDVPEGVVGRGVFGSSVFSCRPGGGMSLEQGDGVNRFASEPPSGLYGHAVPGNQLDLDDSPEAEEDAKEKMRIPRTTRDRARQQPLDQPEGQYTHTERTRRRVRAGTLDAEDPAVSIDLHLNGSTVAPPKADAVRDEPPPAAGPPGSQSPAKSFSPAHQPSPPTVPPNPRTLPRLRRAPSLGRARPSLSHSSDDLSPGSPSQKRDLTEPPELRPFSKPDLALTQSFKLLSSEDWEKKIEGMTYLRSLALYHSDALLGRLHDVCLALIQEVKNLRSSVSRVAVETVGDLYVHLQRNMDQELEATARALLQKAGECNAFIRQHVDAALGAMVEHCTPTRCISVLLAGGLSHRNSVVRKCAAQHLSNLTERVGAARLLCGGKDLTDRILPAVAKLSQDSSQEARYFGRRMLLFLSSHRDFDKMLEKYIPARDQAAIRDTVFTLKTKGLGEMPQDTPSARGRRSLPGSGTVRASSLTREPLVNRDSQYNVRAQVHSIADKTEYISQISALLSSKDFRERIKGIDQLVADCKHSPNIVIGSIFPLFDAFKARLQESNSKVNLHALESLQKIICLLRDNLAQVVYILVPGIVDNHLNSKNGAIYTAAIGAVHALMQNLDNSLLLQPLCTKAQFLNGKAKVDLIEKVADIVTELYPRKPQLVEQRVLPLLWHLLGTPGHSGTVHGRGGSMRGATASLCHALYTHMGAGLAESAASQPANVHKGLNELLRTASYT